MRQSRPNKPTRWEPRWTRLLEEEPPRPAAAPSPETTRAEVDTKKIAGAAAMVVAPVVAALMLWQAAGVVIETVTQPGGSRPVAAAGVTATATPRIIWNTAAPSAPSSATPAAPAPTSAVSTSAPLPTAPPAPSPTTQSERVHLVERGDTLFSIARRNGTTVNALVSANGLGSSDTVLSVGRRLVIP